MNYKHCEHLYNTHKGMARILKPLNNYVMKSRTLAVQDYCFITLTDYPL